MNKNLYEKSWFIVAWLFLVWGTLTVSQYWYTIYASFGIIEFGIGLLIIKMQDKQLEENDKK